MQCPYCGETFELEIDAADEDQELVEDCYVCCRPIAFRIEVGADGEPTIVEVRREND